VWREIADGLTLTVREPCQRAIAGCAATINLFGFVWLAVFVLYVTRTLGLSPGALGIVLAGGGVGAVVGAVLASPLARRFGAGPTLVGASVLFTAGFLPAPFAAGPDAVKTAILLAGELVGMIGISVFDTNAPALRQLITPPEFLGRASSVTQFITQGAKPIGALAGGALGSWLGIRPTLWIAVAGTLLSVLWTLFSPLRELRDEVALERLAQARPRPRSAEAVSDVA
jgi:predicted MFS family arabinose efflux permease